MDKIIYKDQDFWNNIAQEIFKKEKEAEQLHGDIMMNIYSSTKIRKLQVKDQLQLHFFPSLDVGISAELAYHNMNKMYPRIIEHSDIKIRTTIRYCQDLPILSVKVKTHLSELKGQKI